MSPDPPAWQRLFYCLCQFISSHRHIKQQSSRPGKLLSSAGFSFQDTQVSNTHELKRAGLWWGFVGLLNTVPPPERSLSNAALEHNSQLKWCRCKPLTGYCCCKHLASLKTPRKLHHAPAGTAPVLVFRTSAYEGNQTIPDLNTQLCSKKNLQPFQTSWITYSRLDEALSNVILAHS